MTRIALFLLSLLICSSAFAQKPIIFGRELMIFGGPDHDEFLGCLKCGEFNLKSICNEFGRYGSEFSSKGVFNEFSRFGSQFSLSSPWNEYSTSDSVPVIVDKDGRFYGHFTINKYRGNAVEFAPEMKRWFDEADGELEKVRARLCEAFGRRG